MDYTKIIDLILNNPSNSLSTTSIELLDTMKSSIELDVDTLNKLHKSSKKLVSEGYKLNQQHNNIDWRNALESSEELLLKIKKKSLI